MAQLQLPPELWSWQPGPVKIDARAEISRMLGAGYGASAAARSLNVRGIPTPSGRGRWHPETVRRFALPTERARWNAYMRGYRRRESLRRS